MTQSQLLEQRAQDGERVRRVDGRGWVEYGRGFYEPVHLLDRLRRPDVRRPGLCWGYRAALADGDAGWANGSIPIHLMTDLASYDWHRLPDDSRRYLKKFDEHGIRLVRVDEPTIFHDQGYALYLDWRDRVIGGTSKPPSREAFLARKDRIVVADGWLVLAGIDESNRLRGYMTAWVVDDTAYLQDSKVATDALRSRLGTALDHTALRILRESGGIRQVSAGLHAYENETLTTYKLRQGFEVVHVPARVAIPAPITALLRRLEPGRHYRLTGRTSPVSPIEASAEEA